jgi:tRNA(fMet)-specific endonuclease VapC
MIRYLLDTNIISSPISKSPDPFILHRLEEYGEDCAIAAPVWHELTYGCQLLAPGKRRTALETYLAAVVGASFPVLSYDAVAAAWHAQERARLQAIGRPASFVDGQIAAIAHTYGLILITANARDFKQFKGVEILNWSMR